MSLIPTLIGAVSGGLFNAHPKDSERLGRNAVAFAKASAGDDNALKFLLYRSQQPSHVNGYCTYDAAYMGSLGSTDPKRVPVEGWPTSTTREDAKKKYNAALTARQNIGTTLAGVGVTIGTGAEGATSDTFLGGIADKFKLPGWVVPAAIVAAVVLVWLVFSRKGR